MPAKTNLPFNFMDGSTLDIIRLPNVPIAVWDGLKTYLSKNPSMTKLLQQFDRDPDAPYGWLPIEQIAVHYETRLADDIAALFKLKVVFAIGNALDVSMASSVKPLKIAGGDAVLERLSSEEVERMMNESFGAKKKRPGRKGRR